MENIAKRMPSQCERVSSEAWLDAPESQAQRREMSRLSRRSEEAMITGSHGPLRRNDPGGRKNLSDRRFHDSGRISAQLLRDTSVCLPYGR